MTTLPEIPGDDALPLLRYVEDFAAEWGVGVETASHRLLRMYRRGEAYRVQERQPVGRPRWRYMIR